MLAEKNEYIAETAATVYKLTQDERVRMECEAREDFYRTQLGIKRKLEKLETKNQELVTKNEELVSEKEKLEAEMKRLLAWANAQGYESGASPS